MKSSTIIDVAKKANVSISTVSHVLNKTRFVSKDKCIRVLDAVKSLNYRPNELARSLRNKSTKTIGIIVADLNNAHFTEIVKSCESAAYALGYNTILCNTDEDYTKEKMYLKVLLQKQIDGIIISPTCKNINLITQLVNSDLPVVFIDRYIKGINANYVGVDNFQASYQAVSHLISLGHKKIDILYSLKSMAVTQDRIDGYQQALSDNGISFSTDSFVEINGITDKAEAYEVLSEHYKNRDFPDAFFAAGNILSLFLLNFFNRKSIICPNEIGLIGIGDYAWAEDFRPELSMVELPVNQIGKSAISVLMSLIRKKHTAPKRIILETKLNIRSSCGNRSKNRFNDTSI